MLLRWALAQGEPRDALNSALIQLAQMLTAPTTAKQLTGVSANGKSFSYTVPAGADTISLGKFMEEALTLFDSFADADGVTAYLAFRPPSRTVSRGAGFIPTVYPYPLS